MATLTPAHALAVLRWQWVRWAGLRGAAPAALLAALALAALAAVLHARAGQRLEAALAAAAAQAQALAQAGTQPALPAAQASRAALQGFITGLPAADAPPEVLQSLFELAQEQGLRLVRGSYRLQPEPAAAFARYRMTLPVQGDPARVEGFVQAALLAWPSLAVESIQFKRAPGAGRVLEARVQWVLFVRVPAAARAVGVTS
jgi:hypothetical protein